MPPEMHSLLRELLGLLWIASLMSAGAALFVWARACHKLGRLWEPHHVWYGVALMLPPPQWLGWWSVLLWALGWWIAWDDAHLHEHQAERFRQGWPKLTGVDDRASFWHRLAHRVGVI